jgi:transposase
MMEFHTFIKKREKTMKKITTIGLDLAKNVFHVVCCDARGKIVRKRMLKRAQVLGFFANLPRCCVAMEACAGAHYWGRQLVGLGFEVKLIAPRYVKAYVRGNKNDYNDALAIVEASERAEMRFVALKCAMQQDVQALHRLRQGCVQARTALCSQIRGLVGEYGLVAPKGIAALRRRIPEWLEEADNGLSELFRELLATSYERLQELDRHISDYDKEVKRQSRADEGCVRLQTLPGFGPVVASVFRSQVGSGEAYRRGRDAAAALGLVPRQHSSGGKEVLLGISKRGDRYLRSLLIHGARAAVIQAARKTDPLSCWINRIRAERGHNKAVVALANKMARMGWAILAHKTVYQPA